jgi:ABC-type transport system involved in multi-copper enzyme maturation permease subunit
MAVWTICRLTLREASRRRLLQTVAALTLLMIVLTGWGFSRLNGLAGPADVKDLAAGLLILVAYMFDVILALGAVFIAAPTIAGDVDSGVALAMLPRPIRRADLVLGKWLALAMLVSAYGVLSGALEFIAVDIVVGYVPPHPLAALIYLAGQGIVLLTLAFLCSTRLAPMTTGLIAVILFGAAWMGGIAEAVGMAVGIETMARAGTVLSLLLPTDGLWRGAIFNMEPAVLIAFGGASRSAAANPFVVAAPPTLAYQVWAVAWVFAVLGLAVRSFSSKDL